MSVSELVGLAFFAAYFFAVVAAWMVPGLVKRAWVIRQDGLLAHIRAHYVLGEQAILAGNLAVAKAALIDIEAIDLKWRRGNGLLARAAVGVLAIAAGFLGYIVVRMAGLVAMALATGDPIIERLSETTTFLVLGLFGAAHGVLGLYSFDSWRSPDEPHGLAERLRQMIEAGRGVGSMRRRTGPDGLSGAREVFGLGCDFTREALDRARRRLAGVHHPDRWTAAAPEVARAHEAAMKRINAAYDQLSTLAR
ncbi:MAG: J domain-containing protein [Hyphomicrobiaceae bacterium]|nr:J domain-containing protein [Hyphomicrobiaceae bacterium]